MSKQPLQTDVCLVIPPFSMALTPSFALALLKSSLLREQISCCVDYANIYFYHALGATETSNIYGGSMVSYFGEYVFNDAAGIENSHSEDDFIKLLLGEKYSRANHLCYRNLIKYAKGIIKEQTEQTVQRILAHNPKLVGCSAIFQQRNASLAILRRLKQLRPDIKTFMGGFQCFDAAGIAMLRSFPFLDFVYFGESDDIVAEVSRKFMAGDTENLPYGVLKQGDEFPVTPPHRIVENMDSVPAPDYNDYYDALSTTEGRYMLQNASPSVAPTIFLETSRGCWWGEKTPCTFCGLNGCIQKFRRKSADKVLAEINEVYEKYHPSFISFTDNIIPNEWFDQLLPKLTKFGGNTKFFMETRSDLTDAQVKLFKDAHFCMLQPGVESLNDHLLSLMHKGVPAVRNIALLKSAKKHNISLGWNILTGFPGEQPEDYTQQEELLQKIEHFIPPSSCSDIALPSNCSYHLHPEQYGMKLKPIEMFKYISPDNEQYIRDIAYMFEDENKKKDVKLYVEKLLQSVKKWRYRRAVLGKQLRLDMYEQQGKLYVTDTRSIASARCHTFEGAERELLLAAENPIAENLLFENSAFDKDTVRKALQKLCNLGFMLQFGKLYITPVVQVTKEYAYQMNFTEFLRLIQKDSKLGEQFDNPKEEFSAARLARLGAENGYFFDGQAVLDTNILPTETQPGTPLKKLVQSLLLWGLTQKG